MSQHRNTAGIIWLAQFAIVFTAWVLWPGGMSWPVAALALLQQITAVIAYELYDGRAKAVRLAGTAARNRADEDWERAVRELDRQGVIAWHTELCSPPVHVDPRPGPLHEHVLCTRCGGLHAADLTHIRAPEHGMTRAQYPHHD